MKKIIMSLLSVLIIFSTVATSVQAAPAGYAQYGELAEEYYQDDLGLLAMLVYAEAGNQDLHGKELVVDVVLNRMDSPVYPNTIRDVIYQKNQFSTAYNLKAVTDECYTAVANELVSRQDSNIHFFCATGYLPYGTPAYKYGGHYFNY